MLRLRTSAMKTLLRLRKCYSVHSSASLAIKTLFWKPKRCFKNQNSTLPQKSYFDHENTAPTIKTMQLRKIIGVGKTIKRQWPWSYLRYSEAVYSTSIIATVFMEIFHELIFLLKNFPNESSYFYIYPTYTIQKKCLSVATQCFVRTSERFIRSVKKKTVWLLRKKAYNNLWLGSTKKNVVLKLVRVALAQIYHILFICK